VKRPRLDGDAAFWMAVAWIASAFALWPVLAGAMGILNHPLSGNGYTLATGIVLALAYAIASFVLVRVRPWRTFPSMLLTLYVVQFFATIVPAAAQVGHTPNHLDYVAYQLLEPISFGMLQPMSFSPLHFGFPDIWPILGVVAGIALGRLVVRVQGGAVGPDAQPKVTMMRMPKPSSIDGPS
jgi:hypothetical protein